MLFTSPTELGYTPRRIVSLVPSITELLFDVGLEAQVVGITKFCIHPPAWLKTKTIIGGTKNIRPAVIQRLQPDLIIATKEENVKEQIEMLSNSFNIFVADVATLEDALQLIQDVGILTGTLQQAIHLQKRVIGAFTQINRTVKKNVAYLIWKKPYMTVGNDTFIHNMLTQCGFANIFSTETRYPIININQLHQKNCEVLFLSSEPFPFTQKHIDEIQPYLPTTKIILADGEMFSWYGSRLLQAPDYFNHIIRQIG